MRLWRKRRRIRWEPFEPRVGPPSMDIPVRRMSLRQVKRLYRQR